MPPPVLRHDHDLDRLQDRLRPELVLPDPGRVALAHRLDIGGLVAG